jgi:protein TonB
MSIFVTLNPFIMKLKAVLLFLFFALVSQFTFAQSSTKYTGDAKALPAAQHYPGGGDSLMAFINRTKVYPPTAKRNRISGTAIVDFIMDENGNVTNAKFVSNPGGGLGDEAVRVVKLLKFTPPGYRFQTQIPVNFKL